MSLLRLLLEKIVCYHDPNKISLERFDEDIISIIDPEKVNLLFGGL